MEAFLIELLIPRTLIKAPGQVVQLIDKLELVFYRDCKGKMKGGID